MGKLKYIALMLLMLGAALPGFGQKNKGGTPPVPPLPPQTDSLVANEMRLKVLGDSMINSRLSIHRIMALKLFIPALVKTLKFRGSYDYPFDSLTFMQKKVPSDNAFRLFSWVLKYDDGTFRYYSAIQMNRPDSLKLIALRDYSEKLDTNVQEVILNKDQWFGAMYYDIFPFTSKGKQYYMLLGWDGNTSGSNKKVLEVLSFDKKGEPVLGAPVFEKNGKTLSRVIFEFNEDATMLLNYIPEHNIITLDHLVPPNPSSEGLQFTYIPNGTYDYFKFIGGKWVFQDSELFETYKNKKKIKQAGDTGIEDKKKENGVAATAGTAVKSGKEKVAK